MKNLALGALVVASLIAFAGMLFASQGGAGYMDGNPGRNGIDSCGYCEEGWRHGMGSQRMMNGTGNSEAQPIRKMLHMRGRTNSTDDPVVSSFGGKRMERINGTDGGCGSHNTTDCVARRFSMGREGKGFATAVMNETAHAEFENAIDAGDYKIAMQLHGEYGFGGPIFEKLNEATFSKWGQIRSLRKELASELGLDPNTAGFRLGMKGWMKNKA